MGQVMAALEELRELKYQQQIIIEKLIREIDHLPEVKEALASGLVKCNFPVPAGYLRHLRETYK